MVTDYWFITLIKVKLLMDNACIIIIIVVFFHIKDVKKEVRSLSTKKSIFRVPQVSKLESINLAYLHDELSKKAPVLTAILQGACRSKAESTKFSVLMAASIVLKTGNDHLCLLQSLIGTILYTGHASKVVCTIF